MRIEPQEDYFRPFSLVIESYTEWVALESALAIYGRISPEVTATHHQEVGLKMFCAVRDAAREQE